MFRRRAIAPLLLVAAAGLLPLADLLLARPLQAKPAGKKVALLIGVNEYTSRNLDPLKFAEPDVVALAEELGRAGFEVRTLRGAEGIDAPKKVSGKDAYFAALTKALRGVGRADTVLLAFSGHGVQLEVKEVLPGGAEVKKEIPFFCPSDAVPTDASTLVSLNAVLKVLDERGGGHNLILVDACRNIVDVNRGARGGVNGGRIDNLSGGTAMFFSCSNRQKARETDKMFPAGSGKGHGVFFHFVLEGLRGGAKNDKGLVTWEQLVPFVKRKVKDELPNWFADLPEGDRQQPQAIGNLSDDPELLVIAPPRLKAPFDAKAARTAQEWWARYLARGADDELDLGGGVKLPVALLPPGKFDLGSPRGEDGRDDREGIETQVAVEISRPFYLGKHEVTVGQFRRFFKAMSHQTDAEKGAGGLAYDAATGTAQVRGRDYSWAKVGWKQSDDHPVVNVSWNDANAFCKWLSKETGRTARLPTEAEWEYACRAGTTTAYPTGPTVRSLQPFANIADRALAEKLPTYAASWFAEWDDNHPFTAPVGSFRANPFGLHDMSGNVWEWCADSYGLYPTEAAKDPTGAANGTDRVLRGGCWLHSIYGRSAHRYANPPDWCGNDAGFRVVVELPK